MLPAHYQLAMDYYHGNPKASKRGNQQSFTTASQPLLSESFIKTMCLHLCMKAQVYKAS